MRPALARTSLTAFGAAFTLGGTVLPASAATPTHVDAAPATSRPTATTTARSAGGHGNGTRPARAAAQDLASTSGRSSAAAGRSGERELTYRRTAESRTFRTPRGSFRTVISTGPLNFRDVHGA